MKNNRNNKLKLSGSMYLNVWHKNGISENKDVMIYQNGKLKNTEGQWENIIIEVKKGCTYTKEIATILKK